MAIETHFSELHESSEAYPREAPELKKPDQLSLLDLLVVVADHRKVVFRTTAVFVLLAIIVSLLLPKSYTATVAILPPRESSSLSTMLESQLSGMGGSEIGGLAGIAALAGDGLGLKNPNSRYVGMFRSRIVEDAVIQRFDLMKEYDRKYLSDARLTFENHTKVDGNAKDGLIHISVEDKDPKRAAAIANEYVNQFRKLSENLAVVDASRRKTFFEQQLTQAKDNLANAEEALKETELKTGLIQVDSQARALIETVANLRAQIAAREMIIQGMQSYATGENAQLAEAKQELGSLRAQLAKLGGSQETDDGLIVPKGRVPGAALEYLRRLRDVKYYETIFEVLARQYELAKLEEAREGAMVQVVDPAVVPDKRSFPKRSLIVIGAGAVGLLIGLCAAFTLVGLERIKENPVSAIKLEHIRDIFSLKRFRATHR
jgi:uncharacterized protein involved in exopolysaccharide biosynthesis